MPLLPWCDPANFNAGYVLRTQHRMHGQGDREPWTHMHEYETERRSLPAVDLDETALAYR